MRYRDFPLISPGYVRNRLVEEKDSQHNNNPLNILLCSGPGVKLLWGGLLDQASGPTSFIKSHIGQPPIEKVV